MIIYGKQIVMYVAKEYPSLCEEIYLAKEIEKSNFNLLKKLGKPILKLDNKKAQALAHGGNHQGYLAKITPPLQTPFKELKRANFLLVLSGVSDVGNIGSLFRSAYALGVDGIVVCELKDLKLEGVIRTSAGAMFGMPFCVVQNTLDVAHELKESGFSLLGTSLEQKGGEKDIGFKKALFLGSEDRGLSKKTLAKMDVCLNIPMKNGFNSLNVGVAGAILMDRMINGSIG
ncbi:23S rRNA (guanosine(2251)-2'-O)-methyltransferase RlmB [Helicobacter burdigaliensis]|uniref:23S rRNA (guanosine(2251)-2'-O)-methyltransferase RlmB n=1 Tax=Helicobacter burdigaliensis TaxID=2315334 RepID=UPI000EF7139A|nr:23S rRNA (guanosine(2251)-2'-O)-methyltransferase RlmB [Helicobacter burdigaliensis]